MKKEQTKNENNVEINFDHNDDLKNSKKINNDTSILGNMLSGRVYSILKVSVTFYTYGFIINNNFIFMILHYFILSYDEIWNTKLNASHYNQYIWLKYSISKDAVYCSTCRNFRLGSNNLGWF